MSTERLFVKQGFVGLVPRVPIVVPTFSNATFDEMRILLKAHDDGDINIYEHWKVGDTKTIAMPEIAEDGFPAYCGRFKAENATIVLVDKDVMNVVGGGKCHFVWQYKNCMSAVYQTGSVGYMNDERTNVGGWRNCKRRTWLNNTFYGAIPEKFRNILLKVETKTALGNSDTTIDTTEDYIFYPTLYNVVGKPAFYSYYVSVVDDAVQWEYYKDINNILKYYYVANTQEGTYAKSTWWLRTPYIRDDVNFLAMQNSASTVPWKGNPPSNYGVAPCGCI